MKRIELQSGEVVDVPTSRERRWGPSRRCPACGEAPVFHIIWRKKNARVSSHINSRGVRLHCAKRDDP